MEEERSNRIEPRLLKGFKDYLPEVTALHLRIVDTLRRVFESFGYLPLETPALEYEETLLGDLGVDANKQIYRFKDLDRNAVGLRFDLTVSLARVIAQYGNELVFPFRRWQEGKVWRYDKPKKGRLREFTQFDADIVGVDASVAADVEIIELLYLSFKELGVPDFLIRVNNRRLLADLLGFLGIEDTPARVFRVLDKLEKVGRDAVLAELTGKEMKQAFESAFEKESALTLTGEQAERLLDVTGFAGDLASIEEQLTSYFRGSKSPELTGLAESLDMISLIRAREIGENHIKWDLSLARGLDYYTGSVFEVVLPAQPEYGSVAGGGRYDDLVGRFAKMKIPGVGVAVGIDRLAMALAETGEAKPPPRESVFIPLFDVELLPVYSALASELRREGIIAEIYPSEHVSLGKQLKYADKAGIPIALIIGGKESEKGVVNLKRLWMEFGADEKESEVPRAEIVAKVKEELARWLEFARAR